MNVPKPTMNMTHFRGIAAILALLALCACSTVGPLSMSHTRRDIVVQKDRGIWIEDELVAWPNLRQEMNKRMITDSTPIMVHFHEALTPDIFDAVVKRLKKEGFSNVTYRVFRE